MYNPKTQTIMETTKKITVEMFNQPNAGEVILNMVKQGAQLDEQALQKVFALPKDVNYDRIAGGIVLEHIKQGHKLSATSQLKVYDFSTKRSKEIIREMLKN